MLPSRLIIVMALCIVSSLAHPQGKKKKLKDLDIHYKYEILFEGDKTIKAKRTPQLEWHKIRDVDASLLESILGVESFLQQRKSGIYDMLDESYFHKQMQQAKAMIDSYRIDLDLSEYQNEADYYKMHPAKTQEQIRKEKIEEFHQESARQRQKDYEKQKNLREYNIKIQKRNDSLKIVAERVKYVADSIELINEKIENERQRKEEIAYQVKTEQEIKRAKAKRAESEKIRHAELIRKYGQEKGDLIFNKKVKIGWSKEMCTESWGKPNDINRTTMQDLVREQWVYGLDRYLYFDNGVLTAIQD
jgi:hypothetical protein